VSIKEFVKRIIPLQYHSILKRTLSRIWCFGKAYHCPVCNSNVRLLKPLGYDLPVILEKQIVGSGLRNAMCPVCGSSDRIRLLYLFLKHKTNLFSDQIKLLHIAPEDSLRDIFMQMPNLDYLTADINPGKVMQQMDITKIDYPENTFDAIICNHVLEHIPDDRRAMTELFRVLKPGGWAILQVPVSKILEQTYEDFSVTSHHDREKHFGQKDHVRIYGKDYTQRLKDSVFKVEVYDWVKEPSLINNKYCLNKDEKVFYCLKPVFNQRIQ